MPSWPCTTCCTTPCTPTTAGMPRPRATIAPVRGAPPILRHERQHAGRSSIATSLGPISCATSTEGCFRSTTPRCPPSYQIAQHAPLDVEHVGTSLARDIRPRRARTGADTAAM
jgi:hypothetical protein